MKPFRIFDWALKSTWLKPYVDPRRQEDIQAEADRELERMWRARIAANETRRQMRKLMDIQNEVFKIQAGPV